MNDSNRKKGLGRGLSSLLSNEDSKLDTTENSIHQSQSMLPIDKIHPNVDQPRRNFNKTKLQELAASISENGIIQPVIVRQKEEKFELIAGERRWRAAQIARLHDIPAIILDISDDKVLEYSIIENIQREDLSPIEEARSYKKLIESHNYTSEEVADVLGKSRSYIVNMTRLLTLPNLLIKFVDERQLSSGHARALIGLENAVFLARKIMEEKLSVRQTEELVKKIKKANTSSEKVKSHLSPKDIDTINLEKSLKAQTKYKIKIEQNKNNEGGKLVIFYKDLDNLDMICNILFERTG